MANALSFVVLLAVLPSATSQKAGTSPLRKDRDSSVTRKLVPEYELPMPPGWNWPEYLKQLKEKDLAGDEGVEMLPPGWKWDSFHSSVQVTELFMSLQKRCPSGLVTIYNAGFSQEGRSLKVLQIGARNDYDAPSTSDLVPEVALSGSIHGDERASTEILLHLAWDLCRRYRHGDTEVIELLGATSIHILPSINPDGSDKRQRQNAKGKDLDSEFPVLGLPRTVGSQQSELPIEVVNVMNWHLDHPFVLSASLHGGALVTSYPMDACDAEGREADCPSEDDPLPLKLARAVADAHGRMSHMASAHSSFDRGVTRGSEWSPILGSMQDWVWHATGSTELTLELHEDKDWSDAHAPRLPFLYLETKDALLAFANQSHAAIKGRVTVTPGESGAAPLDATITLTPVGARSPGRSTAVQEAFGGTFFRLLVPGVEYCMEVAAEGYATQHAAVKLPEERDGGGETRGSDELIHVFRMSRTRAEPVAILGGASEGACAALGGPGGQEQQEQQLGAAEQRSSGLEVLELECQEAELMDEADGSKSLTCINYCKGVDMKARRGALSGFHVTCDT